MTAGRRSSLRTMTDDYEVQWIYLYHGECRNCNTAAYREHWCIVDGERVHILSNGWVLCACGFTLCPELADPALRKLLDED